MSNELIAILNIITYIVNTEHITIKKENTKCTIIIIILGKMFNIIIKEYVQYIS
jgi:hypothetical protein